MYIKIQVIITCLQRKCQSFLNFLTNQAAFSEFFLEKCSARQQISGRHPAMGRKYRIQSLTGEAMQVSQKLPTLTKIGRQTRAFFRASHAPSTAMSHAMNPMEVHSPTSGSYSNAESACTKAYRR